MNTSKAAVVVSAIMGKISSVAGYFFAAIGVLGFIVEITDKQEPSGFVFSLIFLALGAFLIFKGHQTKKRIIRFRRYISLISTQQMTSMDELALSTSQSVDFVKKDLQMMINKRYFANASINAANNEFVISGMAGMPAATAQNISEPETVSCTGCGALNTRAKGASANCNYCGALL